MATESLILIGSADSADAVANAMKTVLGVDGLMIGESPDARIWFRMSGTASAWLDTEPLDLVGPVASEVVGARWQVVVRDTSGLVGRAAVARRIYDALQEATDWQLVLMVDDWGPVDVHRAARTHA